jgi:hypothetical protein
VEGPLSVLRRCYSERRQVQIYTRHRRGLRGSATGFLKAFDKYMNMVRGADEGNVRGACNLPQSPGFCDDVCQQSSSFVVD